jgi:hypothetical protein
MSDPSNINPAGGVGDQIYGPDFNSADAPTINKITPILSKISGGSLPNSGSLSNAKFDVHTFNLKVMLYHNGTPYDLTPDLLQVKTHMAIGEASGKFTLLLSFRKRWDRLVSAMDYVEISFSRYLKTPPVMMRGLVGNLRRTRVADSSGKIHRAITINGENFGKIWSNYYIEYLVQEIGQQLVGTDIASSATNNLLAVMLQENYGIMSASLDSGNITNANLVQGLIDKMLNPYIDVLRQVNPQMPNIVPMISVNDLYQIANGSIIQSNGFTDQTVYDVFTQFGNRPWCEYFVDDYSNGPILFYRDAPYKDEKGSLVLNSSNPSVGKQKRYYMHPEIDDTQIMEEDVGISDNEVYSYFFTYPAISMLAQTDPRAVILGMQSLTLEQESDTENIFNPHVELDNLYRFGFKSLMIGSNSIPIESEEISQSAINLSGAMNTWLVKSFKWTHKMKNGTIRLKGNEHLRIGRYVTQKSTKEEYYIETVDHEITISQTGSVGNDNVYRFDTTIGVTRGRDL